MFPNWETFFEKNVSTRIFVTFLIIVVIGLISKYVDYFNRLQAYFFEKVDYHYLANIVRIIKKSRCFRANLKTRANALLLVEIDLLAF